jgi:adenosine kinase
MITTFGEDGSVVCTNGEEMRIPAVPVGRALDPTGAGDAYRAGLIKGLAMGKTLSEAARIGTVCASYAVEYYGTQEHLFSLEAFWDRYHGSFEQHG